MESNFDRFPPEVDAYQTGDSQQSLIERIDTTLRGAYETARRNLRTITAIGASALTLAGAELAVNTETVGADDSYPTQHALKHSAPAFQRGHYEGHTTQTCSADAAARGFCTEGEKIPVSFTVIKKKVFGFSSTTINQCYDKSTDTWSETVLPIAFPKPANVYLKINQFIDDNDLPNGLIRRTLTGRLNKDKAHGTLFSSTLSNSSGKPDVNGKISCNSRDVRWHAALIK